jgi:hypothetical protein
LIDGKFSIYHPYIRHYFPPIAILKHKKWKIMPFSTYSIISLISWKTEHKSNPLSEFFGKFTLNYEKGNPPPILSHGVFHCASLLFFLFTGLEDELNAKGLFADTIDFSRSG